jgi:hypothetical protein
MRGKGLVWRLARPVLVVALLAQVIVPLGRIATSYRATEAELSLAQVLVLSSSFPPFSRSAWAATTIVRVPEARNSPAPCFWPAVARRYSCPRQHGLAGVGLRPARAWPELTALQAEIGALRVQTHRERMVGELMLWQASARSARFCF